MSSTDWISAIASAVSALGGAFAAVAAFRSARSAHETQQAASNIEFRARLREIAYTVVSIDAEITRVKSLARHLEKVYSDLAIFNGGSGGSRHEQVRQNVAQRLAKAIEISETAKPFLNGTEALVKAPAEDTDRVLRNLTSSLARLKAYASEFETELQSAEPERTLHQQSVIGGRPGA